MRRPYVPGLANASSVLSTSVSGQTFAASATGSSTLVRRAIVLDTPPSIDVGEITDKGSINQRAVLGHRSSLVEDLYREPVPGHVLVAEIKRR